ncbi:hypothetical protein AVEN_15800-1 [Araneus ventricosus]|uniref:Uncharacterized protein n=1 Tax=Araneus ventricosus TaxID=182803 RepID=A0A4Y2F7N9_ARAVE|nr:hypothetical protein AVEN_15800-1 [Araneus ventricosus]
MPRHCVNTLRGIVKCRANSITAAKIAVRQVKPFEIGRERAMLREEDNVLSNPISQLLGHNEHLYVKFPRGYWMWHLAMALIFTFLGLNVSSTRLIFQARSQSTGQYLSVHKDSFSYPATNRRLEEAVVVDWPELMKFKAS